MKITIGTGIAFIAAMGGLLILLVQSAPQCPPQPFAFGKVFHSPGC